MSSFLSGFQETGPFKLARLKATSAIDGQTWKPQANESPVLGNKSQRSISGQTKIK